MAGTPMVELTVTVTPESTVTVFPPPYPPTEYLLILNSLDLRAGEQRMIEHALALTSGNRTKAAKLLGLNVRSLRRKLNSAKRAPATPRDPSQLALV